MKGISQYQAAVDVGRAFVRNNSFRGASIRLGECSAIYWWDDDTPLLEFPLVDSRDDTPRGYVVTSTTRALPPVLEYAFSGLPMSVRLNAELARHVAARNSFVSSVRWYYFSPLEMVAQTTEAGATDVTYYRHPEMIALKVPRPLPITRQASTFWNASGVDARWEAILRGPTGRGPESIAIILYEREPTYYNQNCRAALGSASEPPTMCSPGCISGCAPVACAMMASSWKRSDISGSQASIWPGSSCWDTNWPSYDSDPNRCDDVNATIWAIHDAAGTSCGGSTFNSRLASAQTDYYRSTWGLPWTWSYQTAPDYDDCTAIITRRHPFLFNAVGNWAAYLQNIASRLPPPPLALEDAGHTVDCWGFEASPLIGGPSLYVGMGWGASWTSKWIDFDSFRDCGAGYVSAFS